MRSASLLRIAALVVVVALIAPGLSACNRIVSVEPLLGTAGSAQRWDGAYTGAIDVEKRGPFPLLLRLSPLRDGSYEVAIYTSGLGTDILRAQRPLDLIGRGEVRIADLGDGYAVAQTRCEVAVTADADMPNEFRTFVDMIGVAKRIGALSKNTPQSRVLGPYVYALLRGAPARAEVVSGVASTKDVEDAAQGTGTDVDKWEGGIGDGLLIGSNLVFEGDDVHLASHGGPGATIPFFARLVRKLFADKEVKNSIAWTRVPPEKLAALRLGDRFPAPGQVIGWCNLYMAVPKEK